MMKSYIYLFALLGTSICSSFAQEVPGEQAYRTALESIDTDLEAEIRKLEELRKSISEEKPSLAKRAHESAATLRRKKREYEIAKTTQASVDGDLKKNEDDLKLFRDERNYIDGMLSEFRKNYQSNVPLPETHAMGEAFRNADQHGDEGTTATLDLVEQMARQLSAFGTIKTIEGEALGKDGVMMTGEFAIAGPVSWFASSDKNVSGLVTDTGNLQSSVVDGTADHNAIRALLTGGEAEITLDPTLGNAIAMDEVEGNFFDYIKKGGFWVYPIMTLALIAFVSALLKWFQFISIRPVNVRTVQSVIDEVNKGNRDEAATVANRIKHPAGGLLKRGIEVSEKPINDVEETLYEKFLETLPGLNRGIALIAIASATTPLLGLLGTVTGMIKTFNQITIFGTGDARSLSGGISEALITTAFGLIVAIPALIMHALLTRKIQGIRSAMEMVSLAFINGLKQKNA